MVARLGADAVATGLRMSTTDMWRGASGRETSGAAAPCGLASTWTASVWICGPFKWMAARRGVLVMLGFAGRGLRQKKTA